MSASDNSSITSFRWELVDLFKQRKDAQLNALTSDIFSLQTRPSIQFALFVSPCSNPWLYEKNGISVVLKQFDGKSLEASVKLWIESTEGRKFGETFVGKHVFDKTGDKFGYNGFSGKEKTDFYALYNKHETFYICCELVDLNSSKLPAINCDQEFLKDQWNIYEKFHDAIIKVGKTEFKVSKVFFAAHSKVFENMFMSNFKEGITSTVEVKDVEENTMKHLVQWFYTNQLEDDAPIEKLFTAADKYDIKILKTTCIQLMINSLSEDNAFPRLILSTVHNNNDLKSTALEVISNLSKRTLIDMVMSDEWIQLSNKNQAMAKEVKELIRNKLD